MTTKLTAGLKCVDCGHKIHLGQCKALDAAGDECDCDGTGVNIREVEQDRIRALAHDEVENAVMKLPTYEFFGYHHVRRADVADAISALDPSAAQSLAQFEAETRLDEANFWTNHGSDALSSTERQRYEKLCASAADPKKESSGNQI